MSKASKARKDRAATLYPKDPVAQRKRWQKNWRYWKTCPIILNSSKKILDETPES